jgi:hypothetical protein
VGSRLGTVLVGGKEGDGAVLHFLLPPSMGERCGGTGHRRRRLCRTKEGDDPLGGPSWVGVGCADLSAAEPVSVKTKENGVAALRIFGRIDNGLQKLAF